jgi:glycine oxidase
MARAPASQNTGALRIAVIGGGVIGLACALELRKRGAHVAVYERGLELGGGATIRAAGMLGLASEAAEAEGSALFGLAQRSADLWPAFAAEVERQGGGKTGFARDGAILLARTQDDIAWLEKLSAACQARDLPGRWLEPAELRRIEPAITGEVRAALLLASDDQVDAAILLQRLGQAAARAGVGLRLGRPIEHIRTGVAITLPDGDSYDRVLLATGVTAERVRFEGQPGVEVDPRISPIVPVKGQMLALAAMAGAPRHVVRMRDVYVAPKARWTLVGATEERGRADTDVDPAAIRRLREAAASVVGALADAPEIAAWAGVRPGTPDDAPMIGETAIPGVFAAMGHYRNGILLAPATAETVADQMLDGKVSPIAAAFSPRRFDNRAAAPQSP